MTAGSVIHAITFIFDPHLPQSSGSTSKTLASTLAHAARRFASGEPFSAGVTGSGAAETAVPPGAADSLAFDARTRPRQRAA